MARNKEGLVLLLDVGPSMHNSLPEVEKVCSMLIEKKLIFSKNDEVGVIVFGTEETRNELTKEVSGYEHVVAVQDIKVVDGHLIDTFQTLPRGTVCGDYLDAIVVGMDMLIKKFGDTLKGKKRLCLITDAIWPIKNPLEGTKEDQVSIIAEQMTANGMRMESFILRGSTNTEVDKRTVDENDILLNIFPRKTNARTVYLESATSLLGAIRTRNISPVTLFRGDLEISSKLKIKVWVYKKTSEEKFPTLKKYSDKAPPTDKFATHEVKLDYEYKSVQDPSKVVGPEQRIKGYHYGPQVVPISCEEWEAVKFKPEKSVKLLGFTSASSIMRHYYMKDVNYFIAEPGNSRASLAVSALAKAMKEMNKIAIVRCVWRQNQGSVVLGILTPNISENDNIPDSFYFNVLPFAEDIREYRFPSFSSFPPSSQPNMQQQEAADNLVKVLDLAPPNKQEALLPDFTPNPVLERYYRHLELKSKHPDAAVPPLDQTLKRITESDPGLLFENKSTMDTFRQSFELKENPKLKKSSGRILREKPSVSNEKDYNQDISDAQDLMSIQNKPVVKFEIIGDVNPVHDFEGIMSRRDSPDLVGKAIREMISKIYFLVEDNYEEDNYAKALDCVVALRNACIVEQEPKQFNEFMLRFCKFCKKNYLSSFLDFLALKQVTLISKEEAIDSNISEDEARNFLVKEELQHQA